MLDGIDYRAKVVTMTKIIQCSMTQAAGYSDTYYVWNAPYTYIYMTPTAAFEKGLDDFNLFMLNTKVSDGFIIASSNLSTQLIAQISNGTQSAQTPGDYFKSEMEKHPDTQLHASGCFLLFIFQFIILPLKLLSSFFYIPVYLIIAILNYTNKK